MGNRKSKIVTDMVASTMQSLKSWPRRASFSTSLTFFCLPSWKDWPATRFTHDLSKQFRAREFHLSGCKVQSTLTCALCVLFTARCLSTCGDVIISHGFSHIVQLSADATTARHERDARTYFLLYTSCAVLACSLARSKSFILFRKWSNIPLREKREEDSAAVVHS